MSSVYRSVVSIGPNCMASAMLKRAGLKAYSGPFDWIFSSLDMVSDCIATDFADFLNIDFLKSVPAHRRQGPTVNFCDHLVYKQRYGLDSIFNHYDPRDPDRYQYLRRCVRRFRAILASGDRHLLLSIGRSTPAAEMAFDRLGTLLDARFPSIETRLVRLGAPGHNAATFDLNRGGRHAIFDFVPSSGDDGVDFFEQRDNDDLANALGEIIKLTGSAKISPA